MLAVKWQGIQSLTVLRNKLIYQAGRIATYMLIGLFFYTLGRNLALAGLQKSMSLLIGAALLLSVAFRYYNFNKLNETVFALYQKLKKLIAPLTKIKGPTGGFFMGMLNGILPCGLVYVAAFTSVLQPSAIDAAKFMLLFGLGTLPMILGILSGAQLAGNKVKTFANKLTPIFIGLLGVFFILRGMELGVPYISPVLDLTGDSTAVCAPRVN